MSGVSAEGTRSKGSLVRRRAKWKTSKGKPLLSISLIDGSIEREE